VDAIDRKILNLIQTAFPLDAEPYRWIGEQTGVTQEEAFNRVRKLRESGIIRRIGAVFDPKKLGFVSTLCADRLGAANSWIRSWGSSNGVDLMGICFMFPEYPNGKWDLR
jgi:DNA-binding Lrp family transcriptional regulator